MINNFNIEESIDGYEILRVSLNNKWLYLGSKYNMKKEVDQIQENIKKSSSFKTIIVLGAGNGVWLEDIDKVTSGKEILVIEPDKKLYEVFISKKYNINHNKVSCLTMEDDNFSVNLVAAVTQPSFDIYIFGNYDMVFNEKFKSFADVIIGLMVDKRIGENTSTFFAEIWFKSYLSNLPSILSAETVNNYRNNFKSKPAIIVSAGPSLDKNLRYLKENEDNFIIITAGRTLNTLRKEGIKADFTCIIDASDEMYKVFSTALDMKVPLLFNEETSERIVSEYKGKKIFFSTREFTNANYEILNYNPETLFQGGSVAHACTNFAHLLGCDPIIFIGQDLAFTDNKIHSANSVAENESNDIKPSNIYVKGVIDEEVPTNYEFNIFRKRLEVMIRLYKDTTFINCTEGGAHIEGTQEKKLSSCIDEYKNIIDKSSINSKEALNIPKGTVINNLKKISSTLDYVISLCIEAVDLNRSLVDLYLQSQGKYNNAIKKLDRIDKEIHSLSNYLSIFEPLVAIINTKLSKKFSERNTSSISILDDIQEVADKGIFLNEELVKAFQFGKPLIQNCISKLEEID